MASVPGSSYTWSNLAYVERFKIHHRFSGGEYPREVALSHHLQAVDLKIPSTTTLLFVYKTLVSGYKTF